jgi:hypothetical protein
MRPAQSCRAKNDQFRHGLLVKGIAATRKAGDRYTLPVRDRCEGTLEGVRHWGSRISSSAHPRVVLQNSANQSDRLQYIP